MGGLSTDFSDEGERPYFLWDEDTTVAAFRRALATSEPSEWCRLVGKLMREARDTDVWRFVSVGDVVAASIISGLTWGEDATSGIICSRVGSVTASSPSTLTPLQRELLGALVARSQSFS